MTPERPCTAYFQASVFADSAAVFDALKAQGFAASSVRCLQRRPTGEMLITFSSAHMKKAFVEKNSIQISQRRYAINDSDRFLTYLNIYDAPPELSDNAIIKRLEPFCEVVSYRRGRYPRNKLVFNGNRHFRVRINAAIPSYLRFGSFLFASHMMANNIPAVDATNAATLQMTAITPSVSTVTRSDMLRRPVLTRSFVVYAKNHLIELAFVLTLDFV